MKKYDFGSLSNYIKKNSLKNAHFLKNSYYPFTTVLELPVVFTLFMIRNFI